MKPDETERAEPTPEQAALYADMEARRKWTRNESGVDPCPGGDAP